MGAERAVIVIAPGNGVCAVENHDDCLSFNAAS